MKEGDNKSNEAICHNTDLSWNSVSDTGIFICESSAEMNSVTDWRLELRHSLTEVKAGSDQLNWL